MISVLLKVWHYCQVCDRHIKWPHYNHIAASRHDIVTRSQCHNNVTSQCHKIRNSNYDQIRSAELWSCYLAGLGDVQRSTDNWMTHSKIFFGHSQIFFRHCVDKQQCPLVTWGCSHDGSQMSSSARCQHSQGRGAGGGPLSAAPVSGLWPGVRRGARPGPGPQLLMLELSPDLGTVRPIELSTVLRKLLLCLEKATTRASSL